MEQGFKSGHFKSGQNALFKAASTAAFIIVICMLVHNFNALYYEPVHLGFVDKAKDYGDMAKIENAIWSWAFTSSGIAHMVVGFSMMILGLGLARLVIHTHPVTSQLIFLAAVLSGIGFLLTGITDVPGTKYAELLRNLNPEYNTNILLMTTMIRGVVNTLAIVCLGWLAAMVGWYARSSKAFPGWFGWFSYLLALPGLMAMINPVLGFSYLVLCPIWAFALGIYMRRRVV